MLDSMFLVILFLFLLVLGILLAARYQDAIDARVHRWSYLAGSWIYGIRYNHRLRQQIRQKHPLGYATAYLSQPQNHAEYRMFFLHEIELNLGEHIEFVNGYTVKLTRKQCRKVEEYIIHRALPYKNAEQAFSDFGLVLTR